MSEVFKVKLSPQWDLYPKTTSDFRIYSCKTEDVDIPIEFDGQGKFVINGDMQELRLGDDYIAEIQEFSHPKYGISYKVISIKQEIPKTAEGQYAFLSTIIPLSYVDGIQAKYPKEKNIVDMIREGTLDYSDIKGIGDSVFLKIQKQVNENFEIQDALIELTPLGVTNKIIRKLIKHYGGSVALTLEKIKKNIYILCEEVSGIGFRKVDEYALASGVEPESPYRMNACIEYLLGLEEKEGHCWIDRDNLIESVMDEAELEYKTISSHLKGDAFNPDEKFYLDDGRVGLQKNYYYENEISKYLMELLNQEDSIPVDEEEIDGIIAEIEKELGFELTDAQQSAIRDSIHHNVLIISGRAGSGKSTNLKGVIQANLKVMENSGMEDEYDIDEESEDGVILVRPYETCSFSGKASQRIIEATGLSSQTMHRVLGYNPNKGFKYNKNCKLPIHLVALDEASMVNSYMFHKLMSAIRVGGKLIIIGDVEQLPPIGAGAVFIDMINSGVIPVVELLEVHRQAKRSGILLTANQIRDGLQINSRNSYETRKVGELEDLTLIPFERKPDIAAYIIDICERVKDRVDLMEFQVIVPTKDRGDLSTMNLNLSLQQVFNPSDEEGMKRNGYEFRVGDKIIKRGNDYTNNVYNGTLGYIIKIDLEKKEAEFSFTGRNDIVTYSQEDMKDIELAYALTVHSNQGSQYKTVICALDYSAYKLLSRQLCYVMLSRASESCMFLFENEALRYAIETDATIERNTFLPELLVERYEEYKSKIS
jgi:exodeoxyribonuclease V alpha subunit